jgi:hypothetical protein
LLESVLLAAALSLQGIRLEEDVPAKMRDGVLLRADILRPQAPGRFPAIVYRTPYGKHEAWRESDLLLRAVRSGYLVVVQDVRGRYRSEGVFDPYRQEAKDGFDTIEWVAALAYCDGKVGMAGLSYPGAVQWLAATEAPPHLKAIVPAMCFSSGRKFFYFGGAFDLSWISWIHNAILPDLRRRLGIAGPSSEADVERAWKSGKEGWLRHLPLRELPLFKDVAPFYYEWLDHPDDGPYWDFADIEAAYERIRVPALNLSGWHDEGYGPQGAVANFKGTRSRGSRLVIGPWTHGTPRLTSLRVGAVDFGPNAGFDYSGEALRFFDRWLKGIEKRAERDPPIRLFVMGAQVWREESEWPLSGTRYISLYLAGEGRLLLSPPAENQAPDRYTYDPLDPVVDPQAGELGPFDQSPLQARADVLLYRSEPLESDLEATGPVSVELFIASSAPDTDFVARLLDIHPDGKAYNLMSPTLEVLRARYRESERQPKPLTPGRPERLRLSNMLTSNLFKAGHRIGLLVTSSFLPHFDRNPNTGQAFGVDALTRKAEQTVFHDAERPSRIVLPVVSR